MSSFPVAVGRGTPSRAREWTLVKHSEMNCWDFPGGTVVKNPPANAGETGPSPGPGRSHMLWSN